MASHVRPDLAERHRQLQPFDAAENSLVRALVARPDRLGSPETFVLRRALNLARLWVVPRDDEACVVGPLLGRFRDQIRPLANTLASQKDPDPASFGPDAHALAPKVKEAEESILAERSGRLLPSDLDQELNHKALVLALGGGGGCGYVHLGAFMALEAMGITPKLVVGSSMGAILGLFRAKETRFHQRTIRVVTHGLTFKKLFKILDTETRYAMPGTLRLHLRGALSRFFLNAEKRPMRMSETQIPFVSVVTGVERDAAGDFGVYEQMLAKEMRRGTLGRLLHLKDLAQNTASFLSELVATPGALRPIPLGADDETKEFDALDAVGFSAALPAVIQYDITRDDPRMHALVQKTLEAHQVAHLTDGGLTANVPSQAAWEYVHSGQIGTRNAFIVGLDCFAPQIGRNVLFLGLQKLAAENVARNRPFSQMTFTYKKVLSPAALVPKPRHVERAIDQGRSEFEREASFVKKMLEDLGP